MVAWSSRRAHSIKMEPCDGATATPPISWSRKLCSLSDHTSSCLTSSGSRGVVCGGRGRDESGVRPWPLTSAPTSPAALWSPLSLLKRPSEVGLGEKEEGGGALPVGEGLRRGEQCTSLGSVLKEWG